MSILNVPLTSKDAPLTASSQRSVFTQLRLIFLAIAFLGLLVTVGIVSNTVFFGSTITNMRSATTAFTGFSIAVLALLAYAHVCRMIVHVQSTELQARHMAGHDVLSGLPNRMTFAMRLGNELQRISRTNDGIAIFFLDLDKFKDVNDQLGHAAGDKLLVEFGRRMQGLLRGADTLARFGGDEFAIVQTNVRTPSDVEALARRILAATAEVFDLSGSQAFVGVSIGIALSPANGNDVDALMRQADIALYRAKSEGRNRYSFFAQDMDDQLKLRKLVEDELRSAITDGNLILHYQPQVVATTGRIAGFEALVRWKHPQHGYIAPNDFIPIAEERGLIVPLGEWVLRQACTDAMTWPNEMTVAINISPIQFKHKDYVESVARIIEETGIDPTRIELELTEGVVVDDADIAEHAIMELRALGVRFALDDFGTGYSSLIYLRRFAFDKIKIDKSFLDQMEATGESTILVHSVVHLGRALGLTVTAEGVENEEQHRLLQAVGCHLLQGYLFSRPVAAGTAYQLAMIGTIEPRRIGLQIIEIENASANGYAEDGQVLIAL